MNQGPSDWDRPGVLEAATKLYDEGYSASQISKELYLRFKTSISRNAVIGKMYRLGKSHPRAASARRQIATAPRKPPAAPRAISGAPPKSAAKPVEIRLDPPRSAEPKAAALPAPKGGVGILELNARHCRWPISGEGADMRYCGRDHEPSSDKPWYCNEHLIASVSETWRAKKKADRKKTDLAHTLRRYI